MSLDALAAGASRSSADAGAAPKIIVKARHDTNPDKAMPGDFDPGCKMLSHFCAR
jgi:hypothetical protein